MLALDNDQLIVRDAERAAACLRLLRGGAGATIRGQAAHPRRGAADCGQYREVTGVGAPPGSAPSERVSLLSPERLDFGRFRFRALVTAAQRGLDLPGIEQTDGGRWIGDDPEDLRARRLNLLNVVGVPMRHAGVEWRGETVSDGDHDRLFRPRHHIDMSGVGRCSGGESGTHWPDGSTACADERRCAF